MRTEEDLERPRARCLLCVGDVEGGDELASPHWGVQVDVAVDGRHHQRQLLVCLDGRVLTGEHEAGATFGHFARIAGEREAARAGADVHQRVARLVADSSGAARPYRARLEGERGSVDRRDVEGGGHERQA